MQVPHCWSWRHLVNPLSEPDRLRCASIWKSWLSRDWENNGIVYIICGCIIIIVIVIVIIVIILSSLSLSSSSKRHNGIKWFGYLLLSNPSVPEKEIMWISKFANWYHTCEQYIMMMSSNGNIFRVTGHLCGEFTGHRWIPLTKASDAGFWCFLWFMPWMNGWVNNREAGDLRRHCAHYDVIVMQCINATGLKFGWYN